MLPELPISIIELRLVEKNLGARTAGFEMRNSMRRVLVPQIIVPLELLPAGLRIGDTISLITFLAMCI